MVQHLQLAHPLGSPHDVGGVHGLVRADHDELAAAGVFRNVQQIPGAEHIVFHCFTAVGLHQGHMLVGRGVDDHIGLVFPEDPLQLPPVRNGDDLHTEIQKGKFDLQLLLDIVSAVFVDVQDHQLPGADLGDLPGQLAADGAAAAGNQNGLAPVVGLGIVG